MALGKCYTILLLPLPCPSPPASTPFSSESALSLKLHSGKSLLKILHGSISRVILFLSQDLTALCDKVALLPPPFFKSHSYGRNLELMRKMHLFLALACRSKDLSTQIVM